MTSTDPPPPRYTSSLRLLVILGVSLAVVVGIVVGISLLTTKSPEQPRCPEDCQGPPVEKPLNELPGAGPGPPVPTALPGPAPGAPQGAATTQDNPSLRPVADAGEITANASQPVQSYARFSPEDKSFSVAYPGFAKKYRDGVSWTLVGGKAAFYGVDAQGATPRQVVERLLDSHFPNATLAYEIPNARVGYEPGYGVLADVVPQSTTGNYEPQRVLIMAAVKNGVALVVEAAGPHDEPKNREGHATGVNLTIARHLGYWVNSFMWKGDPPR